MKTTFRKTATNVVVYLMIGMIGLLIANNAVFFHAHHLSDGTMISHAHPYHKSDDSKPYKSHHHTQCELVFLNNVHIFFLVSLLAAALSITGSGTAYADKLLIYDVRVNIHSWKGRAPPLNQ